MLRREERSRERGCHSSVPKPGCSLSLRFRTVASLEKHRQVHRKLFNSRAEPGQVGKPGIPGHGPRPSARRDGLLGQGWKPPLGPPFQEASCEECLHQGPCGLQPQPLTPPPPLFSPAPAPPPPLGSSLGTDHSQVFPPSVLTWTRI